MKRYVIAYFSNPSEKSSDPQELKTIFIEGSTKDDVLDKFYQKLGAFSMVVSCNLTKSCGGSGLLGSNVNVGKNVTYENIKLEEVSSQVLAETLPTQEKKKIKVVNRGGKISNASRIRQKIVEAKEAGKDKKFVADWAVATLGQTPAVAKSYVKNIWGE